MAKRIVLRNFSECQGMVFAMSDLCVLRKAIFSTNQNGTMCVIMAEIPGYFAAISFIVHLTIANSLVSQ